MTNRKVALVTGAGSGIGKATALALGEADYALGVLGDDLEDVTPVADELKRIGCPATALKADISDEGEMHAAVQKLVTDLGRLDVVIANAGINGVWAPIDDLRPEEWDRTIAVNLRGTYLTIHTTVPHLKAAGGGSIVVVSSINGTRTFTTPGATAYTATKAGQVAMVQQLARSLPGTASGSTRSAQGKSRPTSTTTLRCAARRRRRSRSSGRRVRCRSPAAHQAAARMSPNPFCFSSPTRPGTSPGRRYGSTVARGFCDDGERLSL